MKARLIGDGRWPRRARSGAGLVVLVLLTACGPRPAGVTSSAPNPEAGYAEPPRVISAERISGEVIIEGKARPDSRVRLVTPEGQAFGGTAGADGAWAMPTSTAGGPQLYAVGEDLGGRVVRGEGAVLALPAGRPAALLRAGGGALALGAPSPSVQIGSVDYDASGWAFVSGLAAPGAAVQLQIDSEAPTDGKADSAGRYSFTLKPSDLGAGHHHLTVSSGASSATTDVAVSPAGPISDSPFQATREARDWRINWRTPGGGVQTSLILDP